MGGRLSHFGIALALLLLTSSLPLLSQTNRGGDQWYGLRSAGRLLFPRRDSHVINIGANEKFVTKTTNAGTYVISNLDPVTYRVEVETPGFREAIYEGVKVDTATVTSGRSVAMARPRRNVHNSNGMMA